MRFLCLGPGGAEEIGDMVGVLSVHRRPPGGRLPRGRWVRAVVPGTRHGMIKRALWQGLLAGTAGGVVMTLGEKIEQAVTGRPDPMCPRVSCSG